MFKDYSPLTKLIWAFFGVIFLIQIGKASYGWSIEQTALFTIGLAGVERARGLAWVFQIGPQVLFAISATATGRKQYKIAKYAFWGGWALNAFDGLTNLVAFNASWPTYKEQLDANGASKLIVMVAQPCGYLLALLVTFGEEVMAVTLASIAGWTGEALQGLGRGKSGLARFLVGLGGGARQVSGADIPHEPKPQPTPHHPPGIPEVINIPVPPPQPQQGKTKPHPQRGK